MTAVRAGDRVVPAQRLAHADSDRFLANDGAAPLAVRVSDPWVAVMVTVDAVAVPVNERTEPPSETTVPNTEVPAITRLNTATRATIAKAEHRGVTMREAAFALGIERVADASHLRGYV